jgi:hypothetical protein
MVFAEMCLVANMPLPARCSAWSPRRTQGGHQCSTFRSIASYLKMRTALERSTRALQNYAHVDVLRESCLVFSFECSIEISAWSDREAGPGHGP